MVSHETVDRRRNRDAGRLDLEVSVALNAGRIEQSSQNRLATVLNVTADALRRRAERSLAKMRRPAVASQTGLVRHPRENRVPGQMTARAVVGEEPMLHRNRSGHEHQ